MDIASMKSMTTNDKEGVILKLTQCFTHPSEIESITAAIKLATMISKYLVRRKHC